MNDRARHSHSATPQASPRRGFTLVEMLVVMGVIVVLISILVPLVMRSYRQAGRMKAMADLETIRTALTAYQQDHGDIPRIPVAPPGSSYPPPGAPMPNLGAATLCKALLGPFGDGLTPPAPLPVTDNSDPPAYVAQTDYAPGDTFREATDSPNMYVTLVPVSKDSVYTYTEDSIYAVWFPNDGADGPGFRKRLGGAGPVSPAYLQTNKIQFRGSFLLDHYGNPILYFPASPRKRDVTQPKASTIPPALREPYVDVTPDVTGSPPPLYDAQDNLEMFARRQPDGKRVQAEQATDVIAMGRIRAVLGDYNLNGYIDAPDGPPVGDNYLLWTAGPDNILGPINVVIPNSPPSDQQIGDIRAAVQKCDDILSFRR